MTSEKYLVCLSVRMIGLSDVSLHVCGPKLDHVIFDCRCSRSEKIDAGMFLSELTRLT